MRTTVDLPDELLRRARARAAEEGSTLTALLADGLRLRLDADDATPPPLPTSRRTGGLREGLDARSTRSLLDAADG